MSNTLDKALNWCFKKSIWVYHVNAGGCNGCDIEILDVLTPYYDVERFGIKLVHTPRHADALLVAGPVTRQVRERVLRIYEATPDPKLVVGVGSCAMGGGIWHNSYATLGGLGNVLPVAIYIPGCPPRPEAILYGVAQALGLVPQQVKKQEYLEVT
ncbi:MAG: NADH-quinone oxidoreductase subunit B family protein [Anaerolineales bacterium]|nr:NADH-quinone oxidoreductase subunit B family protein [Anaerolineales bacterium]